MGETSVEEESIGADSLQRLPPTATAHKPVAPAAARMAHVVNSIKEGFRKLGAGVLAEGNGTRARRGPINVNIGNGAPANGGRREGGKVLGVKRKAKGLERQSSFELYLSSLPKVDPVDRTVRWLFHHQQLIHQTQEETRFGHIAMAPCWCGHHTQAHTCNVMQADNIPHTKVPEQGTLHSTSRPGTSSWQQPVESTAYETSLSYYESARGTGGRGTPPLREDGQPRLDDLFRQLQVRQERDARRKLAKGEQKHLSSTSRNLQQIPIAQVPGYPAGMTHDLLPFISQHTPPILHKNSSYYNQGHTLHDHIHHCEWGRCHMRFLSAKDMLTHLQDEHIAHLPPSNVKARAQRTTSQQLLKCEWRGCTDSVRGYTARYKLLMHIKTAHVQGQQRMPDSHTTHRNR